MHDAYEGSCANKKEDDDLLCLVMKERSSSKSSKEDHPSLDGKIKATGLVQLKSAEANGDVSCMPFVYGVCSNGNSTEFIPIYLETIFIPIY